MIAWVARRRGWAILAAVAVLVGCTSVDQATPGKTKPGETPVAPSAGGAAGGGVGPGAGTDGRQHPAASDPPAPEPEPEWHPDFIDGGDGGGPQPEGGGGETHGTSNPCCSAPGARKVHPLGELTVTRSGLSAILAVGAFRTITIHRVTRRSELSVTAGCAGGPSALVEPTFRADATSPFGAVAMGESGLIPVLGSDLQLRSRSDACDGPLTYSVAGVD
jgi:hypothetical protein